MNHTPKAFNVISSGLENVLKTEVLISKAFDPLKVHSTNKPVFKKFIAKGTPRNRWLIRIDEKDNKRVLTYTSKKKAENGFLLDGFYCGGNVRERAEKLEAIKCKLIIEEII